MIHRLVECRTEHSIVPLSIEAESNITAQTVRTEVLLSCTAMSYPRASIQWFKDGEVLKEEEGHLEIQSTNISNVIVLGSVMISSLRREDNGTYLCQAVNAYNMSVASQDVLVLEPPEVNMDLVEPMDSRTAFLQWSVHFRGNIPIKRFHLQVKNFSTGAKADWLDVDDKIPPNVTSYTVRYLAPAVTYGFQIAAVNDAGHSSWENLNVTMPADVPPKVSWVQMLASTNETLLFGWRRPSHDNGSNITHYVVQLSQEEKLVSNETLHVLPAMRNNHMFIFVGLEPGECYNFQVQACSILGCGNWSDQLEAVTSDGLADPPENVEMKCFHDSQQNLNYVVITWDLPHNVRGSVQGYNVTLEGRARYRNLEGQIIVDHFRESTEVKNENLEFKSTVKPNTNYTVRVCTLNRAGCGPQSRPTSKATCASPPTVPSALPHFKLQPMENDEKCNQLRLKLQRLSERYGFIRCYRVIIIKLGKGEKLSVLPSAPQTVNISTYEEVHNEEGYGAYIAEAFNSENFVSEVIIGDGQFSVCEITDPEQQSPDIEVRMRRDIETQVWDREVEYVYDGALSPNTNYTGFVEVHVWGTNGSVLSKQSPYFTPTNTGSLTTASSGSSPPVRAESPVAFIFGVICGTILVVLVLVLVLCLLRRKNGHPYDEEGEHLGLTALIRRTVHRNGHLPRGSCLSKLPHLGPIAAEELPAVFVERHRNTDLLFQSEFEALPETFRDRTTHASDSPENLCKNRYQDIKAYDQTRVRLPAIEEVPGSDYINANFVEGYRGRKMFICAQGPLDQGVIDFWRMIWEHRIFVIVMLTGVEEQGKIKCAQYWSDEGAKEVNKLFTVNLISLKKYSDYIVRRLQVQYEKDDGNEEREILHFHFLMWKDFLAPEQPSWLLRFIKRVNEHYTSDRGPLLVHCSAGVGRTGTFVAIDTLLQQLDEEGQVDVFTCITNLRYQRNFLVQSLKQYIFIYRALMEHAQFGDTEIEMHHLRDHYILLKDRVGDLDRTGLELEFEKLNEAIEDPKTCCVGSMEINKCKNRYDCIIPYDINRVILPPSPSEENPPYINASFIQGYDRSLSFIITQDPMPCTLAEFWRMMKDHTITILVMLSDFGEEQTHCHQYWPDEGEEETYNSIKVRLDSTEKGVYYIKRTFYVTNIKTGEEHILSQFQLLEWSSSSSPIPDNIIGIVTLIEDVQQCMQLEICSGPITVHCSGGGNRSSIFVTLSVLIQQLKTEERVDVFQAARHTRSQRHWMLQTVDHYDLLYKGLLVYLETHNLCDMGDTQL